MNNQRIVLASRPTSAPSAENFRLEEVALAPLDDGQVRIKNAYLSLDPYMRGRMSDAKSYAQPQPLNETMIGGTVGEVVESRNPAFAVGDQVVGIDNLNDYYDVQLKLDRLARLTPHANFRFIKLDVADREGMERLFAEEKFDRVIHLAAQAGVRYSITHPNAYLDSNLTGFGHILEGCRAQKLGHLVYAYFFARMAQVALREIAENAVRPDEVRDSLILQFQDVRPAVRQEDEQGRCEQCSQPCHVHPLR